MVHLRIVVPSYQAEHALELLGNIPSVCNLIYLERAARRPEGDVILCDVAREDASIVIGDLRELDIDVEGSIALEDIDSQVSTVAEDAERAAEGAPSDAVVWEEVEARTSENIELSLSFLTFMVLAMLIAAVGIVTDQLLLIIGAMVVGPEFGPIAGLCVAAVQLRGDLARRSSVALLAGFPLGIAATVGFASILRLTGASYEPGADHPFTQFISSPDAFSFIVAYLAGTAGVLSLTSAKSGALIGVLISVTTIPAAANVGVAAAFGDWHEMAGAAGQLGLNLVAILLAGLVTLYLQRVFYVRRRHEHLYAHARQAAGLPVGRSRRAGAPRNEHSSPGGSTARRIPPRDKDGVPRA